MSQRPDEQPAFRPLAFEGGVAHYETSCGTLTVPKERQANLRYRKIVNAKAKNDRARQAMLMQACKGSCLYWLNTFAWTYLQMVVLDDGRMVPVVGGRGAVVPFVTWPVQDDVVSDLIRCIQEGQDVAIDKSRDMGLSWLILAVFHWFWLFQEDVTFLEVSRKLALVDNAQDPDSLFWKHEFLNRYLPAWMKPMVTRASSPTPRIVNQGNGNTIIGHGTSGEVGHGGRKTAVLFDEISRMREAKTAWEGAASMTACRIGNSTHKGPVFFAELVRSPKVHTIQVPWWDHPDKGKGRHTVWNKDKGRYEVTSPWRDGQLARAVTAREVAENIDRDPTGAGKTFFDYYSLNRHRSSYCRPPILEGELRFRKAAEYDEVGERIRQRRIKQFAFRRKPGGPLRLWIDLLPDEQGLLRPPQHHNYVIGADVGHGVGANPSTASIWDTTTRKKVGEFESAALSTAEFADLLCMLGFWFGGARRGYAFLIWERNGVGSALGRRIARLAYPWFYREEHPGERTSRKTPRMGWNSTRESKIELLEEYGDAVCSDDIINPSDRAIDQATQYVWWDNGGVGPGLLEAEPSSDQITHGDLVIADAVGYRGLLLAPRTKTSDRKAPPGSLGERREQANKELRKRVKSAQTW